MLDSTRAYVGVLEIALHLAKHFRRDFLGFAISDMFFGCVYSQTTTILPLTLHREFQDIAICEFAISKTPRYDVLVLYVLRNVYLAGMATPQS